MDDREILERADLNLLEFNREGARWTTGGVVHEEDGLVFFVPGHGFPFGFTGVVRVDSALPAAEAVARRRDWFAARGQGYTHCLRLHRDEDLAAALEAGGLSRFGNSPGMVIDAPLPEKPLFAGVRIDAVKGEDDVREFARVTGAAYASLGMPEKVAHRHFADARFFAQPHVEAYLARLDGVAVAASMLVVTHGVGGIYWVATRPEARGRGLAEACTRHAGNVAFDKGADFVALQASVMGEPVYRRMGYREITRYPWYVVMP
jgi:ribosomal protein S18 acetylase RimI-like enzyme